MSDVHPSPLAKLTEEAFLADRQRFFVRFAGFTFWGAAGIAALLLLMAVFLL